MLRRNGFEGTLTVQRIGLLGESGPNRLQFRINGLKLSGARLSVSRCDQARKQFLLNLTLNGFYLISIVQYRLVGR